MIFVDQSRGKTAPTLNYTNRRWAITIPRGDGRYEKGTEELLHDPQQNPALE